MLRIHKCSHVPTDLCKNGCSRNNLDSGNIALIFVLLRFRNKTKVVGITMIPHHFSKANFYFWIAKRTEVPFSTAKQASAWGFAPQLLSPPTPRWNKAQRTTVLLSSRGSS